MNRWVCVKETTAELKTASQTNVQSERPGRGSTVTCTCSHMAASGSLSPSKAVFDLKFDVTQQ